MDAKMKGMVMAAMSALCLVLGIMGAMGNTWLVPEDEEEGMDAGAGLTSYWVEMDAGDADTCDMMADMMEGDGDAECDGSMLTMSMTFSDDCEAEELDDYEESCDMATGGMIGTIGMWAGVLCALLVALTLILPMAGVDAMDAMPDMGKMITSWGAGGLMLVGILGWWMMLPDGGDMTMGMSSMMAIGAALLGLAAAAMDQFMDADE